ncbi:MAG: CBS domain-containing protein [Solirubrobacterales bacterium]
MPDTITQQTIQEVEPLKADDPVGLGARRVIEAGLPALPVVNEDREFAGIFGEREFMTALFPGYVGELSSAAMVPKDIDATIDRREHCREEPVSKYMTTDHVVVEDEYSDTQLAEIFLHHRVLVVPIATKGKVHAVVTRNDFFRAIAEKLGESPEDVGD